MATSYTIGALARAAGVPTTTLRYYERRGLLRPVTRSGSGHYRSYGGEELERLRFIRGAQASGFVLDDVGALLALRDGTAEPCKEVQDLVEARIRDVAERVRDLQRVDRVLKASLRMCRLHKRKGRCEVIDTLSKEAASGKRRSRR